MISRASVGMLLGWAGMLAARGAQGAATAVGIKYEAGQDCPTVDVFLREVRLKAEQVQVVPSADPAAPVRVALRFDGSRFVGRLELHRDHAVTVREFMGASCEETSSALAFVVALALVPESASPPVSDEPAAPGPLVVESTRTVTPPVVIERGAQPTRASAAPGLWWVGIEGGARTAPMPVLSLMERAFVEFRPSNVGAFPAAVGLAVANAGPVSLTTGEGVTRLSWLAGRLSLCLARFPLSGRLDVVPCLGAHTGVVWASGSPSSPRGQGGSADRFWFDALAEVRADLRASDAIALRLGFETIAVLTRSEVVFDNPNTVVFQMPTVAFTASLGIAVRIW